MTCRVLFLGNSLAGMLYQAKDDLAALPDHACDWFVSPANNTFVIDPETTRISVPDAYTEHEHSEATQLVGGRDGAAHACDYDVIIYSALGSRPPGKLLREHTAYALSTSFVSEPLLRSLMLYSPGLVEVRGSLLALRAAGFKGRIICEPWIRPCALPRDFTQQGWDRFCAAEALRVAEIEAETGVETLARLPGQEIMTDPDLLLDPEARGPHGNAAYAKQMMKNVITRLETV